MLLPSGRAGADSTPRGGVCVPRLHPGVPARRGRTPGHRADDGRLDPSRTHRTASHRLPPGRSRVGPAPDCRDRPRRHAAIERWSRPDPVTGTNVRMGVGFGHSSRSMPVGVNDETVWWAGLGGSMAVVDLEQDLVVVYAMNRMFPSTDHVMRSIRVVHAAHAAVRA
ncbi:MAG: hypothetical protein EBY52_04190 [Actinobacteria bacterium]|nr:hypothetical protein [Actinomycetota bacterium]